MGGRKPSPPKIEAPKLQAVPLDKLTIPRLVAPREVPLPETFGRFLSQEAEIPKLVDFAGRLNREYQARLESGAPGTLAAARAIPQITNQLLSGVIPADVQAEVARTTAQRGMGVGLVPTSGMARALQARDFGITSMDLMQRGVQMTPGALQIAEFLSPQDVTNYLFSTGQLRAEDLKRAADIAMVQNMNAMIEAQIKNQQVTGEYSVGNVNAMMAAQAQAQNDMNQYAASMQSRGSLGGIGGLFGGIAGFALGGPAGAGIGSALGSGLGSFASGGGFTPTGVGGAFGGLMQQAGGSLFPGFGGLLGGSSSFFGGGATGGMGGGFASASYFPTSGLGGYSGLSNSLFGAMPNLSSAYANYDFGSIAAGNFGGLRPVATGGTP